MRQLRCAWLVVISRSRVRILAERSGPEQFDPDLRL